MTFIEKLLSAPVKEVMTGVGNAAGSVMDRFGFTKKLSEAERITNYIKLIDVSEASTDSARKMAMAELTHQKQPWLIGVLSGLVRPLGGLGSLLIEFYVICGSNISTWIDVEFIPIVLTTEQHLFLGAICAFYFGSRSFEKVAKGGR